MENRFGLSFRERTDPRSISCMKLKDSWFRKYPVLFILSSTCCCSCFSCINCFYSFYFFWNERGRIAHEVEFYIVLLLLVKRIPSCVQSVEIRKVCMCVPVCLSVVSPNCPVRSPITNILVVNILRLFLLCEPAWLRRRKN